MTVVTRKSMTAERRDSDAKPRGTDAPPLDLRALDEIRRCLHQVALTPVDRAVLVEQLFQDYGVFPHIRLPLAPLGTGPTGRIERQAESGDSNPAAARVRKARMMQAAGFACVKNVWIEDDAVISAIKGGVFPGDAFESERQLAHYIPSLLGYIAKQL